MSSRDCLILNPALSSESHLNQFRFLGVLMGVAIRTGSPLSLNLAEPMWKLIAGSGLTPSDITEIDKVRKGIQSICFLLEAPINYVIKMLRFFDILPFSRTT